MKEYIYDERQFPEYGRKLDRGRRSALSTFLVGGVVGYLIFFPLIAFVLFPQSSAAERLQIGLILLGLPIFFGALGWFIYRFNRQHPLRIGKDMVFSSNLRIRFEDIVEIIWLGPQEGAVLELDPGKYRFHRQEISGDEILRPEEFLKALEGRVRITTKERPSAG